MFQSLYGDKIELLKLTGRLIYKRAKNIVEKKVTIIIVFFSFSFLMNFCVALGVIFLLQEIRQLRQLSTVKV